MKNLTLHNIAKACKGTLFHYEEAADKEVSGVVLDSRKVEQNYLFIATKGEKVDGHSFIPQVIEKGAAGIICEKVPDRADGTFILVEDSFQALKDIARFYRQQLDIKVVGITGSVGKTSTKEFIAAVLETGYEVLKTEGNFNNEVGLPLTMLRIRDHHEVAVIEMGISDFGEMNRLSEIARPDICVLTNIGQCHLENLKSREGILRAKTEIFDHMQEDGLVCINGDDDMLETIDEVRGRKPVTFGLKESNRVYAEEIVNKGLFGSSAKIHIDDVECKVQIPLPGEHMVYNALAAACVGSLMGLKEEEIVRGIGDVKPVGGRSHIMRLKDKVVIDDCYNANPISMCAAIDLLATALTRKAAVMGDMFELGENEKEMHAKVGAYAVEKGIDIIVCIGGLSRNMYEKACEKAEETRGSIGNIYYFATKEEFLEKRGDILHDGDTILVKASHGMAFEEIVKVLGE